MDYKQKYLKYKQKYLRLLKDQKGGEPFLIDLQAKQAYLWLFAKNQRRLAYIFTQRLISLKPLGNIRLNDKHRLSLMAKSGLSLRLASLLVEDHDRNLMYQLAKRIISRLHDKLLKLTPTPTCVSTIRHNHSVNSVAFHPTLSLLATGSDDRTVKLWDCTDPQNPILVANLTEHTGSVTSIAFHPTLYLLATGSSNGTVKIWR